MLNKVSIYADRERKKSVFKKGTPPTMTKIKKEFCPLCNLMVAPADSERRVFLVHGKKIPFKLAAFKECCQKSGWEIPDIHPWNPFDVEPWLIIKAKNIADMPIKDIGEQWSAITSMAETIGLKTNFIQAVARP